MNPCRLLALGALLLVAGLICWTPAGVQACATAHSRSAAVAIADESAIIIWDEKSQMEHFIRRASFTTDAKDFGFLVPTPSIPTMAEATDEAFRILAKLTEPRVVTQKRAAPGGGGCVPACSAKPSFNSVGAPANAVEVVDSGRVSGFQYDTLKATDADELSNWLEKNQYDFSPALKEWAKHYIEAKWLITAFKVEKGADGKAVATKAVRMSFKTPQPFFPYREPDVKSAEGQPNPSRLLRVYLLSTGKVKGTLGEKGPLWPGKAAWANKISAADREKVLEQVKLPKDTEPESWWLTEFEDKSSPRPGSADVFFSPAGDNDAVERPPHVQYVAIRMPDCVMTYALVAFLLVPGVVRRLRRRSGR